MAKDAIPRSIQGFTEYMENAYQKTKANLKEYGIADEKFDATAILFSDYIGKAAAAGNPDTATHANRLARNVARNILEKAWRRFMNECIRYNRAIGTADLAVYGILPRDGIRTPGRAPTDTGTVQVNRLGMFEYEITVVNERTSKRKLPEHAAGSYIYMAVSEMGVIPEDTDAYRKLDFSSNARHRLRFNPSDLGRQANVYVRYASRGGKEGPAGPVETFFIN